MIWYVVKRLLWIMLTLWAVFTVTFFLMHSVKGGPFDRDRKLEPEIERNLLAKYDLDKPLATQYWMRLTDVLHGDLGPSYRLADFSVNEVITEGFPISASLGLMALLFALVLGCTAGIVSAVRRQSWLDFGLMSLATVGIALPSFVIAGISIILFVFLIPLFPAAGWGSVRQLILPAFCLGAPYAAYIARLSRTGMLDVLSQDYIRTAYAKGLPNRTVILRHAMKGAMLPVVSYMGPAIADILTGSLVVEQIFFIPGLGTHFIQAALVRDYTLAMGVTLLYTALVATLNLIVDVSYRYLDPRITLE